MLFCFLLIQFFVIVGGGGSGGGCTGCPGGGVCRLLVASFWLLIICGCWFRLSPASGGKGKNGHFGEGTLYCMKNRKSKTVYWFKLVSNVLWLKLRYTLFD